MVLRECSLMVSLRSDILLEDANERPCSRLLPVTSKLVTDARILIQCVLAAYTKHQDLFHFNGSRLQFARSYVFLSSVYLRRFASFAIVIDKIALELLQDMQFIDRV